MGLAISVKRIAEIFDEIDIDNSGDLDYQEFMRFMMTYSLEDENNQQIRPDVVSRGALVVKYGKEQKNPKSDEELKAYLTNKGLSKGEVRQSFEHYDEGKCLDLNVDDFHTAPDDFEPFPDERLFRIMRIVGHGYENSRQFTDLDLLRTMGAGCRLHAIQIWFKGATICGIQTYYKQADTMESKGKVRSAPAVKCEVHGRKKVVISLSSNEYIQGIRVAQTGKLISGLVIDTNTRAATFGDVSNVSEGDSLMVPTGGEIIAFYGTIGRQAIESLGVYVYRRK